PESSTDFIFAIIGEEGGFILAVAVIVLFLGFAYCGIKICMATEDLFASLFAFGLTFIIVAQAFFNIGVVTGVLPTTGVPLPFISFGGSALFFNMVSVGILMNIPKGSFMRRGCVGGQEAGGRDRGSEVRDQGSGIGDAEILLFPF
ncbi:FtsW/RodA/SpoVE family cell cycle protein, partial [Candidatus Desantisbacteria bacterium]|nr:FtsW/RodA/SpoVE family cell cycle protein [Candidatus Desantisbacteria bacterium]